MLYMLQASLTLALLYSVYRLFLGRTGFHRLNRFVLIGIALTRSLNSLLIRKSPTQHNPLHPRPAKTTFPANGQPLQSLTIVATGQPLTEPIIFYWLRSRNGNPTLTRGYPSDVDPHDLKMMQNLSGILRNDPASRAFDLHGAARIGD